MYSTVCVSPANQATLTWFIQQQHGKGYFDFRLFAQQRSGDLWLENCKSMGGIGFDQLTSFTGPWKCTITAHGGNGEGIWMFDVGVSNGRTTAFWDEINNRPINPIQSYEIKVHVVDAPETENQPLCSWISSRKWTLCT